VSDVNALLAEAAGHAAAGRVDAALASYRAVLDAAPELAEIHYNVGALHHAKGDAAAAERSFTEALRYRPQWLPAALALAHVLFGAGRYADAQRALEYAVELAPDSVEARGNLGLVLQRRGRADLALPHLQHARALAPLDTHAWFALRGNLLALGRFDEAVEDFLRFESSASLSAELVVTGFAFARAIPDRAYEQKYLALALDWRYRADQTELVAIVLSRLQYFDAPRETLARMYRLYDRVQQENPGADAPLATRRRLRIAGEKIRIGYLSADLRAHVMGRLLRDVLAAHDRSMFSLHLYSLSGEEDALTAEFRTLADSFSALADVDDHSAARLIAAGELDVLVDLMGHSAGSRPDILRWKPAPVIATHLGYHGCIGLSQVDYKITDEYADVADAASYQVETPLPLAGCVLPVRRVEPAVEASTSRAALGIRDDEIVFGAFVALIKLSPRCLALWREILARLPFARIAFSPLAAHEAPRYLRRLGEFGIGAERVLMLPPPRDDADARARYRVIDVVLDTMPYSGGDTTAAALDMRVPVVTRVGERHAERVTYSLLAHLGVADTVAHSDDDYVALACRLAQDAVWRAGIAEAIAARLPASGLADPAAHARSLEAAYLRALGAPPKA